MDGITARLTGTIIEGVEVRRIPAGGEMLSFNVLVDSDRQTEMIVVRVSVYGDSVPGLALQIRQGAHVFVRGRLTLRTWKNGGERRTGRIWPTRRVELIGECDREELKSKSAVVYG